MKNFKAAILFVFAIVGVVGQNASAGQGLTKIADNIYSYVDAKDPSPANSFGANAGIIIGRDGIMVVDTLISAKEAKRFIADIRRITDKPVRYVVNTHYHLDHSLGNSEFEKLEAAMISQADDADKMRKTAQETIAQAGAFGLTQSDMEGTRPAYASVAFNGGMEMDLGGQKVELIYPGPSHTKGSILVYLPDKKVLFAGDILFTKYHPFMGEGDVAGWVRALDYVSKMDVEAIIPGHGPVSSKRDVAEMKDYIIAFDKKSKELCGNSKDMKVIAEEMKNLLPERPQGVMMIKSNLEMMCAAKQ